MLREAHPSQLADDRLTVEFPAAASFHRQLAEEPKNATLLAEALYEVTGRKLALDFAVGENGGDHPEEEEEPAGEDEIVQLMKDTFDAREVGRPEAPHSRSWPAEAADWPSRNLRNVSMDVNKMMQQVQQLQAQMAKAQEELANETVEASAGGGMVTVKATGALQVTEIKISPEAIDPDDPEMLADMVLAAVNEALRSAQSLQQSKLGGVAGLGDLGNLGLPGM